MSCSFYALIIGSDWYSLKYLQHRLAVNRILFEIISLFFFPLLALSFFLIFAVIFQSSLAGLSF